MSDWFRVHRTDTGIILSVRGGAHSLSDHEAADFIEEVQSVLSSMPPTLEANLAAECHCCPECQDSPCADITAGGFCPASCWCEDDSDEDSWDYGDDP